MFINCRDIARETRWHLEPKLAESLIQFWDKNWKGGVIYLTRNKPLTGAAARWYRETTEHILAHGGSEADAKKIRGQLASHFLRF